MDTHSTPPQPEPQNGVRGVQAPGEIWKQIRRDFQAGMSAPACARRYGVGVSTLRARAAEQGWRRMDLPWVAPEPLDADDEGLRLDEATDGDLAQVSFAELAHVARQRMKRAVLSGQGSAALRWRRVAVALADEDSRGEATHRIKIAQRVTDRLSQVDPITQVLDDLMAEAALPADAEIEAMLEPLTTLDDDDDDDWDQG
jgi:hypothetical protein